MLFTDDPCPYPVRGGGAARFLASLRNHVGAVYQIAWSADSRLLVSGSKDSTMKVWDVRTRKLKEDLPGHADEVFAVDWSPDGDRVASGGRDRVLKVYALLAACPVRQRLTANMLGRVTFFLYNPGG